MIRVAKSSTRKLPLAIYASCAGIIAAFLVLAIFVLSMAGGIADRVRLDAETQLVTNELDRQIELLARDQSQISHWDKTVEALGDVVDMDFVSEQIAGWLWVDLGIETTVVISPEGASRIFVERDEIRDAEMGQVFVKAASDLIALANALYMQRREPLGDGYTVPGDHLQKETRLFIADIRPVMGQMKMVVAQAIVPDETAILPAGAPQVLLTFKPLSSGLLKTMGQSLGLSDFKVVRADAVTEGLSTTTFGDGSKGAVVAEWQSEAPSVTIWSLSIVPVISLLCFAAGILVFLAGRMATALSALEASERQNRFLAQHDALTGLPNRLQIDQALEDTIAKGADGRCAILSIDLDRFKAVNDTYGHHAGDVVIRTVATRIARAVGTAGIAARIGGDEFLVLLFNELDSESVARRCDQLIESVSQPVLFEGGVADVGASIGVAWWPADGMTAKSVVRSADEALYLAKQTGRGCVCVAGAPIAANERRTHAA